MMEQPTAKELRLARQLKEVRAERKELKRRLAVEESMCLAYYRLWWDAKTKLDRIESADVKHIEHVELFYGVS